MGHKAWECESKQIGSIEEESGEADEDGEEDVHVGTVWGVGAVDKEVAAVSRMKVDSAEAKKKIEVTVDSGAGASCWPEKLLKDTPMGPQLKRVRFKAANGAELKYYGTKKVKFHPREGRRRDGGKMDGELCEMNFHVTDAAKPLAAAMAIVKLGNRIVVEDGPGRSYIESLRAGDRVLLRESGGAFVFDVDCAKASSFSRRG